MTGSGYIDFSSPEFDERDAGSRRRPRPSTLLLIVVLGGISLFATWAHLGRVHQADLVAFDELGEQMMLLDRDVTPLLHGSSPPCQATDAGVMTRSYSSESGPTARELSEELTRLGWTSVPASPPALFSFESRAGDHRLTLDVMGPSRGQGATVQATSSASSLGCRFG